MSDDLTALERAERELEICRTAVEGLLRTLRAQRDEIVALQAALAAADGESQ